VSSVVAIGVFDGLHLGHRRILGRALERAAAAGAHAVVVSFDPHPDVVLAKTFQPLPPLTPLTEKRERLRAMGFDAFEVLPFTREMAALEPEEFVARHLVKPLEPQTLVVGENFALGRGRSGDVARLRQLGGTFGFALEAIPLHQVGGEAVSSTRIRAALAEGRVADAARWLGRAYGLTGLVVGGDAVGRTLGWPTANLRLHEEKFVPRDGIYAVWARPAGDLAWRPGAMSIGVRPTFGGTVRTLEVHLIDWEGDLLGRDVEVAFADWLRPEMRFDSPAELVDAIGRDVAETRERLRAVAPPGEAPGSS
jgi:riboflavin kinase/FMN adenylyltransferase